MGEALPKSDAKPQRNRDRPLFEAPDVNGAMTSELREREDRLRQRCGAIQTFIATAPKVPSHRGFAFTLTWAKPRGSV